ncbi:Piso0_002717 [Millerozyma farinosa CBS 7064]|uniref:2',3'-cyclic-nucleotide 3'-phosphodiesterase n=1 Tax=Pichia sorbitophila (strain ATCC MYA-4447 / BCRC 22081 / CBS 7064 / NBRC 10061 / NRRL Y-12695) TaxID=559304 RepID=G8YDB7_PICSO|nr:Piso0_002717 [Millerozyma farinosa CBS 7064]
MGVALWLCPKANTPLHDKLVTLTSSLSTLFPGQPPKIEPHVTVTSSISINLDDPEKTKEEVYKILTASATAIKSLPKNHCNLVTLGKVDSHRSYLKKLYFHVRRDPNLISFATIIRELFVILPQEIEHETMKKYPHLYTTNENGLIVRKKKGKHSVGKEVEPQDADLNLPSIQKVAQEKASHWSQDEYDPHLSLVYSNLYPIDNALWRTIKTRIQDYLNIDHCDSDDLIDNGLDWDNGVLKLVLCEGDVNDWVVLGSVDLH